MKRFGSLVPLACILVLAVGLRAWHLLEMKRESAHLAPAADARYHDYWARALATGDWTPPDYEPDPLIRSTAYFRQPGYPYFLAAIYRAGGSGPWTPRIVQMVLGLASCLLAYALARRVFSRAEGLVLAALMAVYWSFIYFEGELLEPVLVIPLELLFTLLLVGWTRTQTLAGAAAAGAVLGALALVRSTVLPFAGLVPAWSWFVARRQGLPARRWALLTAAYAAGALLAISPATVRNAVVAGEFVPISANDGINLYLGNNERANGMVAGTLPGLGRFASCFDYPAIVRALERQVGAPLTLSEASAHFRGLALAYVWDHPGRTLSLLWKKTLLFWGPLEVGHNREDEAVRANSAILGWLPGFPFALTTCVLGLALYVSASRKGTMSGLPEETRSRQREAVILVLIFIATYFLTHLPFFVAGRYRVPLVPFLLLFGAFGLCRLWEAAVRKNRLRAVAGVAAGALLYLLFTRNFAGYRPDRLKYFNELGYAYAKAGDDGQAMQAYRKALSLFPYSAEAHMNLASVLKKQGHGGEAERHLAEALRYEPASVEAHLNLAMLLLEQGRDDRAIDEYRQVLALRPEFAEVHVNLGFLLRKKGLGEEAARHFAEAIRQRPNLVEAHLNLADLHREAGRTDLAVAGYRRALSLRPGLDQARKSLEQLAP